mgnify:CR=1 FL=1
MTDFTSTNHALEELHLELLEKHGLVETDAADLRLLMDSTVRGFNQWLNTQAISIPEEHCDVILDLHMKVSLKVRQAYQDFLNSFGDLPVLDPGNYSPSPLTEKAQRIFAVSIPFLFGLRNGRRRS